MGLSKWSTGHESSLREFELARHRDIRRGNSAASTSAVSVISPLGPSGWHLLGSVFETRGGTGAFDACQHRLRRWKTSVTSFAPRFTSGQQRGVPKLNSKLVGVPLGLAAMAAVHHRLGAH